jgi:hypothetical protein
MAVSKKLRGTQETLIEGHRAIKTASVSLAKAAEKERLAAALRENLKRRKAQVLARSHEPAPDRNEEG